MRKGRRNSIVISGGGNIFYFLQMHGYGEALQALAFLNPVDGGSVGYLIVSRCLMEAGMMMVTMCVLLGSLCV